MKRPFLAAVVACAGLASCPAQAHDYWLSPAVLVAKEPTKVAVSLFVGESFVAEEEKTHQAERTVLLQHWSGGSSEDLAATAVEGAKPAYSFVASRAGGHLLVLERNPARIEMAPAKFDAYLREEGLEAIVDERKRLGESDKPGRERYTRHLKALVQVGDVRDDTFKAGPTQMLAIVPQENPAFVGRGKTLGFSVIFRGEPLANATVEAIDRVDGKVQKAVVKTRADGSATVTLRGDIHLLRMVHMVRCEGCEDADWQSFWSSYIFGSVDGSQTGSEVETPSEALGPPSVPPSGGCACETAWARRQPPATAWVFALGLGRLILRRSGRRRG